MKGKHFKGKTDHQTKPGNLTGEDVLNMVKDVKVVFEKAHAPVQKQAVLPVGKPLQSWFPNWEHESGIKGPLLYFWFLV